MVAAFIDEHRDRFGVEPICRVLTEHGCKIAPSTYYAHKTRPPSARAVRDAELVAKIREVFFDRSKGRGVSGARKIWRLLRRDGVQVARCTVERLMRHEGLRGAVRGRRVVTTRSDEAALRPPDLTEEGEEGVQDVVSLPDPAGTDGDPRIRQQALHHPRAVRRKEANLASFATNFRCRRASERAVTFVRARRLRRHGLADISLEPLRRTVLDEDELPDLRHPFATWESRNSIISSRLNADRRPGVG